MIYSSFVYSDVLNDSTTTADGQKTYLEVIKEYYDNGHEIASHTLSHKNLVGLSEEEVKQQLNDQSDIIYKAIGKRIRGFRPPEGVLDKVSSKVLKDLDYYNVLWDIDTKDWQKKGLADEQSKVKAVLDKDVANKTMGHISLEHDIHEATVNTLVPWLTKYVQEKGLSFVTVSDCVGEAPYHADANSTTEASTDVAENKSAHDETAVPVETPVQESNFIKETSSDETLETPVEPLNTINIDLSHFVVS